MKKYFLFGLLVAVMPSLCLGVSARYTQLVREKQRKMEQLEKCMGVSKGLKIAGVSTLGLTAVGVVGNIYEANALKTYDSQIKSAEKKIKSTEDYIDEKKCEEDPTKEYKDGQCVDKTPAETQQVTNDKKIQEPKPQEPAGDDGVIKSNCTQEFLTQNNAVVGVECGVDKLDTCCIKKCKEGYHTTLNGEIHPIETNDDLDTDLICEPDE